MAVADWEAHERTEHNVRTLCHEVAWAGVAGGIVASFLSIFALRLGATPFEVGLLTTGPALAGILFPLPAARLVSRMWGKPVVIVPLALYRMLFAFVVIIPMLPAPSRVALLVGSIAVLSIALAFFNTAFVPLLAKVLPLEVRARAIAARGVLAGLTSTLAVLVAGKILDILPFPLNFQIIFALAFVAAQISTALVARVHIPTRIEEEPPPPWLPAGDLDPPLHGAEPPWPAAFWRHTGAAVVFLLGIYLPIAFYPIVLVNKLHATNGWIGALAMAGGLAAVGLSPLWGRATTRYGNRPVLVTSGLAYALVPLGASLAPTLLLYAPVAVAQAGVFAIVNQGLLQNLYDVLPQRRQPHYVALYSVVASCAVAAAPPLGTYLLGTIGMNAAFRLAAAIVLLGSVLLRLAATGEATERIGETRPTPQVVRGDAFSD
jgi:MFS family permease